MMLRIYLFVIFFITCSYVRKIPFNKLVPLLYDLSLADEYLKNYNFNDTLFKNTQYKDYIFINVLKKHHVSRESYNKTIDYYLVNYPLYQVLLDSVISYANKQNTYLSNSTKNFLKSSSFKKHIQNKLNNTFKK